MRNSRFHHKVIAAVVWIASVGMTLPASAIERPDRFFGPDDRPVSNLISVTRPTLAPFSYIIFCQRDPSQCDTAGQSGMVLDPASVETVRLINVIVNGTIRPKYDRGDTWSADVSQGDCEDYALTKRHLLIDAGLPAGSLRMAVVATVSGETHAVLVARTSNGDVVLDNLTDQIRPWNDSGLSWKKIASDTNPRLWYTINQ